MTIRWLERLHKNQKGITLVELLVVIAISGPITYALSASIFQLFSVNAANTAHMTAVHEVESAVHSIIPDAEMAQTVSGNLTDTNGLFLNWTNNWTNTVENVTYKVQDGRLARSYSLNGGLPNTTILMQNIDTSPSMTSSNSTSSTISFKITATVSGFRTASETRSFSVVRRSTP